VLPFWCDNLEWNREETFLIASECKLTCLFLNIGDPGREVLGVHGRGDGSHGCAYNKMGSARKIPQLAPLNGKS
jgi:hypothetical protein